METPYILAARGTYKLMVVDAWMLKDGKLQRAWRWDGDEENPIVRSMGAHSMVTADVDGDGRDEILLGSCMLDDNGTLLWSSGLGHSDKAYLCKLHPDMEGMQVFMVSEPKKEDGRGVFRGGCSYRQISATTSLAPEEIPSTYRLSTIGLWKNY